MMSVTEKLPGFLRYITFWGYYLRYTIAFQILRIKLEVVATVKALVAIVPLFARAYVLVLRKRVPLQDALYTVIKSSKEDPEFKREALEYLKREWGAKEIEQR